MAFKLNIYLFYIIAVFCISPITIVYSNNTKLQSWNARCHTVNKYGDKIESQNTLLIQQTKKLPNEQFHPISVQWLIDSDSTTKSKYMVSGWGMFIPKNKQFIIGFNDKGPKGKIWHGVENLSFVNTHKLSGNYYWEDGSYGHEACILTK